MFYRKNIFNQIFWYNFANYLGIILVFLASIFLYPYNLALLGEIRYIETIGNFIFPVLLFGLPQALVKFRPQMQSYHLPRYFGTTIAIILFLSIIVYLVLKIIFYLFEIKNNEYYIYGFLLAICLAFIDLIKSKAIMLEKVKLPILLEKISPKIALPVIFILILNNLINPNYSIDYYLIFYILLTIALFIYIFKLTIPKFSIKYYFLFENFTVKEFINFSFYSFLSSIGFLLAFRIDSFMIPQYLNMADNGAYSIAQTLSGLIGVPMASVFALNSHLISQLIKDKNFIELGKRYKESATYLYWIGSVFFGLILILIPFLDQIFNNYSQIHHIKWGLFLLSLSMLVNMGTSYNTEIITYSKYYKFNLFTLFILVVSNIVLNYYFLTQTDFKLVGVAIATLFSMTIYNLVKIWFIYKKFNMLPFDIKYIKVVIISIFIFLLILVLPNFNSFTITFLYKGIFIIVLNLFLISKFNLIDKVVIIVQKIKKLIH